MPASCYYDTYLLVICQCSLPYTRLFHHSEPGYRRPFLSLLVSENKVIQLFKRSLHNIIHNNLIMDAFGLRELKLGLCLRKALLDRLFSLSSSALQANLEIGERWRSDEDVAGVEAGGLDLFDALA